MVKLSDIFDLQMGKTPARANPNYWNNGDNQWVSIADLSSFDKYVSHTKESVSDLGVKESGIKLVPSNTVIMSFKLSLGKTAITVDDVYTNEAIMAFIDNHTEKTDVNYIYHLFSNMDWTKGTNRAVMGATLNKATLSTIEIPLPPLDKQQKIAEILDKASSLIELRKAQIEKLDLLIKSKFSDMFGDPVTNPMGWKKCSIDNLCKKIMGGGTPSKSHPEYYVGKIPWVTPKDMKSILIRDSIDHINENAVKNSTAKIVPVGSVLMVIRSGILKKTLPVAISVVPVAINQDMKAFTVNDNTNAWFLYYSFKMRQNDLLSNVRAVTADNIEFSIIKNLQTLLPPLDIQTQFSDFVEQVEQQKAVLSQSLEKLEMNYKALMQGCFNGELFE